MFAVSNYAFFPYKLVRKGVSSGSLICAVIGSSDVLGEKKPIIPHENIILIPFENIEHAHFVCALLNSNISSFITQSTSAIRLTPFVLGRICIPFFDSSNPIHNDVSQISKKCHEKVAMGIDVTDLEEQINELGFTKEELKDIQESLEELM